MNRRHFKNPDRTQVISGELVSLGQRQGAGGLSPESTRRNPGGTGVVLAVVGITAAAIGGYLAVRHFKAKLLSEIKALEESGGSNGLPGILRPNADCTGFTVETGVSQPITLEQLAPYIRASATPASKTAWSVDDVWDATVKMFDGTGLRSCLGNINKSSKLAMLASVYFSAIVIDLSGRGSTVGGVDFRQMQLDLEEAKSRMAEAQNMDEANAAKDFQKDMLAKWTPKVSKFNDDMEALAQTRGAPIEIKQASLPEFDLAEVIAWMGGGSGGGVNDTPSDDIPGWAEPPPVNTPPSQTAELVMNPRRAPRVKRVSPTSISLPSDGRGNRASTDVRVTVMGSELSPDAYVFGLRGDGTAMLPRGRPSSDGSKISQTMRVAKPGIYAIYLNDRSSPEAARDTGLKIRVD